MVRDGVSKYAVNGSYSIRHLEEVYVTRLLAAFEELKEQCRDMLRSQSELDQKLFEELF